MAGLDPIDDRGGQARQGGLLSLGRGGHARNGSFHFHIPTTDGRPLTTSLFLPVAALL